MLDVSSKYIGKVAMLNDITERKNAEEALKKERDRAEKYLNIAEVLLVVLDAHARIVLLNRKGYQILGYDEGELIGKNWIETCLRPQDREHAHEGSRENVAVEVEVPEYYESYVITKKAKNVSSHGIQRSSKMKKVALSAPSVPEMT